MNNAAAALANHFKELVSADDLARFFNLRDASGCLHAKREAQQALRAMTARRIRRQRVAAFPTFYWLNHESVQFHTRY